MRKPKSSTKVLEPLNSLEESAQERAVAAQTVKPQATTSSNHGATKSMSIIQFASSLADAEKPIPLPSGEYTATIRNAEVKQSAGGDNYLVLTVHISPDEYPADFADGDPDGTTLIWWFSRISEKAGDRWRMRRYLETVGLKPGTAPDPMELVDLTLKLRTVVQTFEGEDRASAKALVMS